MSEEKRIIEKTLVPIAIPNSWLAFIDHILAEPDCPWDSRSDFMEDCMEHFLQDVMAKSKDVLELIFQKRSEKYLKKVKEDNQRKSKDAQEDLSLFLKISIDKPN